MHIGDLLDIGAKTLVALGGLGGIGAFFMVRVQKRKIIAESGKTDAQADSIMADAQAKRTDSLGRVVEMYDRGLSSMQERLDEAEAKIDKLTEYVEILVRALRAAGQPIPSMPRLMAQEAREGTAHREERDRDPHR